jgi:hypothetical protein
MTVISTAGCPLGTDPAAAAKRERKRCRKAGDVVGHLHGGLIAVFAAWGKLPSLPFAPRG